MLQPYWCTLYCDKQCDSKSDYLSQKRLHKQKGVHYTHMNFMCMHIVCIFVCMRYSHLLCRPQHLSVVLIMPYPTLPLWNVWWYGFLITYACYLVTMALTFLAHRLHTTSKRWGLFMLTRVSLWSRLSAMWWAFSGSSITTTQESPPGAGSTPITMHHLCLTYEDSVTY